MGKIQLLHWERNDNPKKMKGRKENSVMIIWNKNMTCIERDSKFYLYTTKTKPSNTRALWCQIDRRLVRLRPEQVGYGIGALAPEKLSAYRIKIRIAFQITGYPSLGIRNPTQHDLMKFLN